MYRTLFKDAEYPILAHKRYDRAGLAAGATQGFSCAPAVITTRLNVSSSAHRQQSSYVIEQARRAPYDMNDAERKTKTHTNDKNKSLFANR